MSRSLLALVPLLLLAACGDQQPAAFNEAVDDAGLAQENVVAGDVTAIDAATADDARMANDTAPPAFDGNDANALNQAAEGNNAA